MTEDDRTTLRERYTLAASADNLRSRGHGGPGAVDIVAAAGLAGSTMGGLLLRLAGEFDRVRGDLERARGYVSPWRDRAQAAEAALMVGRERLPGPSQEQLFTGHAARDELETATEARTAALGALASIAEGRAAFLAWARVQATKERITIPQAGFVRLMGVVLDAWLDDRCDRCKGTGKDVATGRPIGCRACAASGRRSGLLGESKADRTFVRGLLAEMDRMAERAERRIGRALGQRQG